MSHQFVLIDENRLEFRRVGHARLDVEANLRRNEYMYVCM